MADDKETKNNPANIAQEVVGKLQSILRDVNKKLDGVRPQSNQQRNLDRETGGLEFKNKMAQDSQDSWDKRGEEVKKMIEDGEDLNNAAGSSREQSFIHRKKQKNIKKRGESREENSTKFREKATKKDKSPEKSL